MKTWEIKVSGYKTNIDTKKTELNFLVEADSFSAAYALAVNRYSPLLISGEILACKPSAPQPFFANPLVSSC